jgi:integrator complex subunit 1
VGQKISNKSGSRVSKRLQKQQQEKIASLELVEASKRKASLRIAQKSIMLWDPDGPARKPPRESADLLLSIEKMFQISDTFQRSVKPDFLLMTIGETTRGAIERAYEWLIPIISRLPDTIARLPSNAACFLLLRAYGTEGEERVQLKELSSPLLDHVKGSLKGSFGELDAIRALDLLLSDVASPKPERRKCARRVLQDSLVNTESDGHASKSWIANILSLSYAKALVSYSIKHMVCCQCVPHCFVHQYLIHFLFRLWPQTVNVAVF